MSYKNNLINKSENKGLTDSVIVLGGCGSLELHPDIITFLEKQGLEVYHLDRNGDKSLGENNLAISDYLQEIRNSIKFLVEQGKRVHLYANSFGGYLALKITGEINHCITSAVAIAPILNPIKSIDKLTTAKDDSYVWIRLPDGRDFPILNSNIEFLKDNNAELLLPSGIIIIGSNDEIINSSEIDLIKGPDLYKYIVTGAKHSTISTYTETRLLMEIFYSNILK